MTPFIESRGGKGGARSLFFQGDACRFYRFTLYRRDLRLCAVKVIDCGVGNAEFFAEVGLSTSVGGGFAACGFESLDARYLAEETGSGMALSYEE